jgi:hypothetical protein
MREGITIARTHTTNIHIKNIRINSTTNIKKKNIMIIMDIVIPMALPAVTAITKNKKKAIITIIITMDMAIAKDINTIISINITSTKLPALAQTTQPEAAAAIPSKFQ